MFEKSLIVGLLLTASSVAYAGPGGSLDLRYASNTLTIEDNVDKLEIEGDGYDLRGSLNLSPQLWTQVSYLSTSADEYRFDGPKYKGDSDLTVLRAGLRYQFYASSFGLYALGDYGKVKLSGAGGSDDESGFLLGVGLRDVGDGPFLFDVAMAYADMGDIGTGALFEFTLGYRITPMLAAVLGAQGYALSKDEVDTSLGTFTLGLKLTL